MPEQPPTLAPCAKPPALSGAVQLAPVNPAQHYVRCGTQGPELAWKVSLSPRGRFLAALTSAGTVRLIDVASWREIAQLASPVGELDAVAFSPDGNHLATLSAEAGQVTLWRTSDGTVEQSWALTPASNLYPATASLSFSSDGRMLATSLGSRGSGGPTVIDTEGPTTIQTAAVDPASWVDTGAIRSVKFVGGDSMLLVDSLLEVGDSNPTETLFLYRSPCGPAITLFYEWDILFAGAALSPDGQIVALASLASGLSVVQTATGSVVASDPTFRGTVLAFAPDNATFYVQQDDVVTALDARTLAPVRSFSPPAGATFRTVAPDGSLIVTTATTTSWLDRTTGAVTRTLPFAATDVAWSADGSLEVDAGAGMLFDAFQTAGGTELCKMGAEDGAITTVATSPLGAFVVYGHDDGTIEVGRADGSAPTQRFKADLVPIAGVAVSDDGGRVAVSGSPSGSGASRQMPVGIFDVADGSAVAQLTFPALWSSAGVLSPDGRVFALGFMDAPTDASRTQALDVASGQILLDLSHSISTAGYVRPDHFSSDGTKLAVATEHGVDAWRLSDATLVENYGAQSRALSPSWASVASMNSDGALSISWAGTGAPVGTFPADDFPTVTFDGDEQIVSAPAFVGHTHGASYFAQHVWDLASAASLRVFGIAGPAVLPRGGEQILTPDSGGDVDVWCR